MAKAEIADRASVERAYPPDEFAADAAENEKVSSEFIKGVRILSAPDRSGTFDIERAVQQVGEASQVGQPTGAAFLTPFRTPGAPAGENRDGGADRNAPAVPVSGYDAFIDQMIEAARRLGAAPDADASPGPGDARLRGPRQ